jgi:alanine racemase
VKSWVEISEKRLSGNYRLLKRASGADTAVLAVVKANAYGHGASVCAPVLVRAGAEWLGVTDAAEGACVRKALTAGIESALQPRILAMSGPLPEDADQLLQHQLTPVLWQQEQLKWLADAAARAGTGPLPIHLEIDTGMARQGAAPGEELAAFLQSLKSHKTLQLDGVMTHFASAEVANSPQTLTQRQRFEQAIAQVAAAALRPAWVHAGNSSTIDNQGTEENLSWLRTLAATVGARSMVRPGIALYGYCLPIEPASPSVQTPQPEVEQALQPIMTWKTRIIGLRTIHPGDTVGYNGIFAADRPMHLALLPIGYADGLRRELSSSNTRPGGWAIIHGQRAPYIGRVSMNLTIIDITNLKDIALGDEVTVLGDGITADDHARLANTIAYEIVCAVRATSKLIP